MSTDVKIKSQNKGEDASDPPRPFSPAMFYGVKCPSGKPYSGNDVYSVLLPEQEKRLRLKQEFAEFCKKGGHKLNDPVAQLAFRKLKESGQLPGESIACYTRPIVYADSKVLKGSPLDRPPPTVSSTIVKRVMNSQIIRNCEPVAKRQGDCSILDLGCGRMHLLQRLLTHDGFLSNVAKGRRVRYVGIDIANHHERLSTVRGVKGDLTIKKRLETAPIDAQFIWEYDLNHLADSDMFSGERFDLVFLNNSLHHVSDRDALLKFLGGICDRVVGVSLDHDKVRYIEPGTAYGPMTVGGVKDGIVTTLFGGTTFTDPLMPLSWLRKNFDCYNVCQYGASTSVRMTDLSLEHELFVVFESKMPSEMELEKVSVEPITQTLAIATPAKDKFVVPVTGTVSVEAPEFMFFDDGYLSPKTDGLCCYLEKGQHDTVVKARLRTGHSYAVCELPPGVPSFKICCEAMLKRGIWGDREVDVDFIFSELFFFGSYKSQTICQDEYVLRSRVFKLLPFLGRKPYFKGADYIPFIRFLKQPGISFDGFCYHSATGKNFTIAKKKAGASGPQSRTRYFKPLYTYDVVIGGGRIQKGPTKLLGKMVGTFDNDGSFRQYNGKSGMFEVVCPPSVRDDIAVIMKVRTDKAAGSFSKDYEFDRCNNTAGVNALLSSFFHREIDLFGNLSDDADGPGYLFFQFAAMRRGEFKMLPRPPPGGGVRDIARQLACGIVTLYQSMRPTVERYLADGVVRGPYLIDHYFTCMDRDGKSLATSSGDPYVCLLRGVASLQ